MKLTHKPLCITLLLSAALALPGCSTTAGMTEPGAAVKVQSMRLAPLANAGISGKIIPGQEIKVAAKLSGKVAEVFAEEGMKVKKGDILLQLESSDYIQQVKQAEAALAAAKAKLADTKAGTRKQELAALASALEQAKAGKLSADAAAEQTLSAYRLATSSYNRLRNQYDSSSAVTKEDLDRGTFEFEKAKAAYEQAQAGQQSAKAAVEAAEARLELAQAGATANTIAAMEAEVERLTAALTLAQASVEQASIVAPIDGMVLKKTVSVGELAQAGAPLFTIVDMDHVSIELSVGENQVGSLQTGAKVDVKVQNIADETFQGTITFISPVSNPNSTTFPVKVSVDNPDERLFAGMIAEVQLLQAATAKLELPKSALVNREDKTYVIKLADGKAHYVEVRTEPKNDSWVYAEPDEQLPALSEIVVDPADSIVENALLIKE